MASSLLPELHRRLQWPSPERIRRPTGAGPAFYQRLAHLKIEVPLARILVGDQVQVNILAGDPGAETSDPPIALVCEFNQALTPDHLRRTRALAWNFCRTPLLITLEPHLLRTWSCYKKPEAQSGEFRDEPIVSCGDGAPLDLTTLAYTLHWSQLASGQFLERHADRFDRSQRADAMLLENLRYVRERLTRTFGEEDGLSVGTAHDLLARVVFVQFLFDRMDSQGRAALNKERLAKLHEDDVLAKPHDGLSSILKHKGDTFALFKWLNKRFNGDLFPRNYSAEEREVRTSHLKTLADFVSGSLQMENGQYLLWPHYSFDTIPLEFISSIYEEFVTKRNDGAKGVGEHYTRPFLVDFMLDKVLPWGGTEHDLKILDPCCGSAVFLVKSFQRLVHRWRNAHPGQNPDAAFLRSLLEDNLFGIDTNENAVRVASFSLYLAMCDEIDPRDIWTRDLFPSLREKRIRTADFFSEDVPGIQTRKDAGQYDLIVGNAPWGKQSVTEEAEAWAVKDECGSWRIADRQTGTLFLAKAARLCKENGRVCMVQPAGSLLFNVSGPAKAFRKKLFTQHKVDEVVNLSALRFLKIFPDAVGPACIITMRPTPPDGEAIAYWSPKQTNNQEGQIRVTMDEQDLNWIWPEEAAGDSIVWPALMWGGRRDLATITRICTRQKTIGYMLDTSTWQLNPGFKRVPKSAKSYPDRLNVPCLEEHDKFYSAPPCVEADHFPPNTNPMFESPRPWASFALPRLILSTTWRAGKEGRFRAVFVRPTVDQSHLLYSQSFFGLSAPDEDLVHRLSASIQSSFVEYYLHMISGRLASYRPTMREEDVKLIPLPSTARETEGCSASSCRSSTDEEVFRWYGLSEVERALVEDFHRLTVRDFRSSCSAEAPGITTVWSTEGSCTNLETYSDWFLRVLQSGFGSDKDVCATIFRPPDPSDSPFCMVGVHLDWARSERIRYEDVTDGNLLRVLEQCAQDRHRESLAKQTEAIYYRRVSRIYQTLRVRVDRKVLNVPTVFLIKPNQRRYWTRSAALRNADDIVADIMKHGNPDAFAAEACLG